MKKEAQELYNIARELYQEGLYKESKALLSVSVKIAKENPLEEKLGDLGFKPSEVFEYGDDDIVDDIHPSENSVHRTSPVGIQEIWMEYNPKTGKAEYGYMHEGPNTHEHKVYNHLDDIVDHVKEEDEEVHSCQHGGGCQCGGGCR